MSFLGFTREGEGKEQNQYTRKLCKHLIDPDSQSLHRMPDCSASASGGLWLGSR